MCCQLQLYKHMYLILFGLILVTVTFQQKFLIITNENYVTLRSGCIARFSRLKKFWRVAILFFQYLVG